MSQQGRLLVTRPMADSLPLIDQLQALGWATLVEPLLTIQWLSGPALDLTDCQAILITSANGIRALDHRNPGMDRYKPVWTVGDASARAARDLGFRDVTSAGGDVTSLADAVRDHLSPSGGVLVHPAGSKVAGDLAGQLERAGYRYIKHELYRAETATALTPETHRALEQGSLAGVLLYSPRTARTFRALIEDVGLAEAVSALQAYCLSEAVADRLAGLPFQGVRTAARPDEPSLLALLGVAGHKGDQ